MSSKTQKILIFSIWALVVAAVVVASLTPGIGPSEQYHMDKIVHAGVYALLAFVPFYFTRGWALSILFIIILFAVGGAVEILQNYVPGRNGTIGDMAADIAGVIVGMLAAKILK